MVTLPTISSENYPEKKRGQGGSVNKKKRAGGLREKEGAGGSKVF